MARLGFLDEYSGNPYEPRSRGIGDCPAHKYFDAKYSALPPDQVVEYIPEYIRYKAGFPRFPLRPPLYDKRAFNVLLM